MPQESLGKKTVSLTFPLCAISGFLTFMLALWLGANHPIKAAVFVVLAELFLISAAIFGLILMERCADAFGLVWNKETHGFFVSPPVNQVDATRKSPLVPGLDRQIQLYFRRIVAEMSPIYAGQPDHRQDAYATSPGYPLPLEAVPTSAFTGSQWSSRTARSLTTADALDASAGAPVMNQYQVDRYQAAPPRNPLPPPVYAAPVSGVSGDRGPRQRPAPPSVREDRNRGYTPVSPQRIEPPRSPAPVTPVPTRSAPPPVPKQYRTNRPS